MFQFASIDIGHATSTVEMLSARDAARAPTNQDTIKIAQDDSAPPPTGGQATTDFYGGGTAPQNPAWAAEATFNPDYAANSSNAPAATDDTAQAAPSASETSGETAPTQMAEDAAPPPTGGQATTDYYGGSSSPQNPAWAAPAEMNPDYSSEPAAPAETAQPAQTEAPTSAPAAEEAPPPPTGGQATTDYYGGSSAPSSPAWAEPAKMNPDYNAAAAPAATEAAAPAPATDACRETVATNAKAATLHFTEDSAAIAQDSRNKLSALADALKSCGGIVVEVRGFTDSVGSSEGNKILSELRAKKIVDFLTDAGVEASKLTAVGKGEDDPVSDNGTAEGRRLNRRVEFVLSGQ
jgi:outer membrane protein OmpA-like peptidoglycan-associated protein